MTFALPAADSRRRFPSTGNRNLNENYRAAAKARGIPLVVNYPVWLKIKETNLPRYQALVPDGSHPSKAGSTEVTWPNIKALLEMASS